MYGTCTSKSLGQGLIKIAQVVSRQGQRVVHSIIMCLKNKINFTVCKSQQIPPIYHQKYSTTFLQIQNFSDCFFEEFIVEPCKYEVSSSESCRYVQCNNTPNTPDKLVLEPYPGKHHGQLMYLFLFDQGLLLTLPMGHKLLLLCKHECSSGAL